MPASKIIQRVRGFQMLMDDANADRFQAFHRQMYTKAHTPRENPDKAEYALSFSGVVDASSRKRGLETAQT